MGKAVIEDAPPGQMLAAILKSGGKVGWKPGVRIGKRMKKDLGKSRKTDS